MCKPFILRTFTAILAAGCLQVGFAEEKLVGEGGSLEGKPGVSPQNGEEKPRSATQTAKFWSLSIGGGMEYDSNVLLQDEASQNDDLRYITTADAGIRLPKFWEIETSFGYSFYKDYYDELDDFDLEGHTFNLGLNRSLGEDILLMLDYSFVWFKFDNEGYLQRHSVSPGAYWRHSDSFATFARMTWDNNDYVQIRRLSGDDYTLTVREYFLFGPENKMALWAQARAGYNKAVEPSESFDRYRFSLGFKTPLIWKVTFRVEGSYSNKRYKPPAVIEADTIVRSDNIYAAEAALSRPIYKEILTGTIYFKYNRQRSSLEVRDYLDHVGGIEVVAKF